MLHLEGQMGCERHAHARMTGRDAEDRDTYPAGWHDTNATPPPSQPPRRPPAQNGKAPPVSAGKGP